MADVDDFGIFIMREPVPNAGGVGAWQLGDIVRVFHPVSPEMWSGPADTPKTNQPRKSVIVANAANLTFAEFAVLREEMEAGVPPVGLEDPDQKRRVWDFTWSQIPGNNDDLGAQGRGYMQSLSDELIAAPYGARRTWSSLQNVAFRNKQTGSRDLGSSGGGGGGQGRNR